MKTKNTSLNQLIDLYDLHSQLFNNVIESISAEVSNNRLGTKVNHPSWITGSLVQQRYELAQLLGSNEKSTFHETFKDYQGIKDDSPYPVLADYKNDWERISPVLKELLSQLKEDKLESIAPMDMGGEITYYQAISFLIDRESYCIGQIGLWRRLLGYPAMKYPE